MDSKSDEMCIHSSSFHVFGRGMHTFNALSTHFSDEDISIVENDSKTIEVASANAIQGSWFG
jgi:hypothetical protein